MPADGGERHSKLAPRRGQAAGFGDGNEQAKCGKTVQGLSQEMEE
jgi:hypothetical protein